MLKIEDTLKNRIGWVVWFRLAFLAVVTTSAFSLEIFYSEAFSDALVRFVWSGAIFSLVSLILNYLFDIRWLRLIVAWSQVVVDSALVTFVIAHTGDASSAFFILYGLTIMTSGVVLMHRGALVAGLLSVVSYGLLIFWQSGHFGWPGNEVLSKLVFQLSSLTLAGAMIAWLFRHRLKLIRSLERTEEDLQNLNALQAAIVDHIPSGLIMVQFDGNVIFANRVAKEIFEDDPVGVSLEELGILDLPKSASLRELRVKSLRSTEKFIRCESVELNQSVCILVFNDVTHLKDLEEKLRFREKLASVGQLAAGLAHEIKNPLASLSGSIQLMQSEMEENESHKQLMNIVTRETDRLDGLLQSFLDYAKPSQLNLTEERLDLMIQDILQLMQTGDSEARDWNVEVAPELEMEMDADKMKQVLWNLFANAVDATQINSKIFIRATEMADEGIRIEVEDSGCGMGPELRSRIFEPFFTKKEKGTGLGLALVYQIVDAHGGVVEVESDEGLGTKFVLKFKKKQNSESRVAA